MPEPTYVPEPDEPPEVSRALALRDPRVPASLDDLAALRGEAVAVMEARATVLETARKRGIRLTSPEDWLLFKNVKGRVTAYLSDAGAARARDLLGVEIFDVNEPQQIMAADGQSFIYVQTASGRSKLTGQVVEAVIGGRSSTEDFCKSETGAALDLKVKKACRANVNGRIVRELLGLQNVTIDALREAWTGTSKDPAHCNEGRGYGTAEERLGATREGVPDIPPPTCPVCKTPDGTPLPLLYRAGKNGKSAFYGCRNYATHPQQKVIIDVAEWTQKASVAKEAATKEAAEIEDARRQDAETVRRENGRREPGQEG